MRPGRLLLCMLLVAGGLGASVLMLGHLSHMLHPFTLPIASRPVAGTAHTNGIANIARRARSARVPASARVLAAKEYDLLVTLAGEPTRVFTRAELLRGVWGLQTFGHTRTLDSHVISSTV